MINLNGLVEKSIQAFLAAVEIYNKPTFNYREESFSILMLNAWELILKARIVQENGGNIESIEAIKKSASGKDRRSNPRTKRNRAGGTVTIGFSKALNIVANYRKNRIDENCRTNIDILQDIRDQSVHLYNIPSELVQRINDVGSATVLNFAIAVQSWFDVDLSQYQLNVMPLSFQKPDCLVDDLQTHQHPAAVRQLLERITEVERQSAQYSDSRFAATLRTKLTFVRSRDDQATRVKVAPNDPNAVPVAMTDDQFLDQWPWTYSELTNRLAARYSDFKQNARYHDLRKEMEGEERYCRVRYLDPTTRSQTTSKKFYNPNIVNEFDKHYSRKEFDDRRA